MNDIHIDDELILRVQRGETAAYARIVHVCRRPAYRAAFALLGSHDDALDVSQQAFIKAYNAIAGFDRGKSFFAWYYSILRNLCLNLLRDRKRHAPALSHCGAFEAASGDDDPAEATDRVLLAERVRSALLALKPEEREIIVLRDFEGYRYAELASMLGIPQGTVMSRLYNARKRLKDLLEDVL